jgi:hypothetical protein
MSTMDGVTDSYLNTPAPSTKEAFASGVTTPDLVAEEKERRQSFKRSLDEKGTAVISDAVDAPQEVYASGRALVPILLALVFSIFLVAIDMSKCINTKCCEMYTNFIPTPLAAILGTAIPKITDDFNGLNSVTW